MCMIGGPPEARAVAAERYLPGKREAAPVLVSMIRGWGGRVCPISFFDSRHRGQGRAAPSDRPNSQDERENWTTSGNEQRKNSALTWAQHVGREGGNGDSVVLERQKRSVGRRKWTKSAAVLFAQGGPAKRFCSC
jgi:hypothetical protein